jgi:hypothetical protein
MFLLAEYTSMVRVVTVTAAWLFVHTEQKMQGIKVKIKFRLRFSMPA